MFAKRFEEVVLPCAARHQLMPRANRVFCASGLGPFVDERSAICYCLCQAPMHFYSYRTALDLIFPGLAHRNLPTRPLVVDVGCGPATTALALGEWFQEKRRTKLNLNYVGIDISIPLLRIASELLADPGIFDENSIAVLRSEPAALSDPDLSRVVSERDGVIFAMSYVLHQPFLNDFSPLTSVMRRVAAVTRRLPTWLVAQDANYADRIGEHQELWPEDRINRLANTCERFGYNIKSGKRTYAAPHVTIREDGSMQVDETGEKANVCAFVQRIA